MLKGLPFSIPQVPRKQFVAFICVVVVGLIIFSLCQPDRAASRATGNELMQTQVRAVEQAKAEDRLATPAETKRVLELRREILDLRERYDHSRRFYDEYMRQLDLLNTRFWGHDLFAKWQAGTLKDKELPKIVRAYNNSRNGLVEKLDGLIRDVTSAGLDFAVLPNEDRVNWDLMTDEVRLSDVQRYEIVAGSLRHSVQHLQSVTGNDYERQQLVAALDRVVKEMPTNLIQKLACRRCGKAAYYEHKGWHCLFCLE